MKYLMIYFFVSFSVMAGFAPHNHWWIDTGGQKEFVITKDIFHDVIDAIEAIYTPIVKENGGSLTIIRKWDNGTVNAYASRIGRDWKITLFGGLARHPNMTPDGFAMVICHELGHHLGGRPRYIYSSTSEEEWASAEGQSDYFAGSKCMKRYLISKKSFYTEEEVQEGKKLVPKIAKEKCGKIFLSREDYWSCLDTAISGKVLGKVLSSLSNKKTPMLSTPSDKIVKETNTNGYPSVQCRVDTFFQGALCDLDPRSEYYCTEKEGFKIGNRPRCWYKE